MLNLFGARSRQNAAIGLELGPEGLAFAHIQRPANQQPLVAHCEYLPLEDSEDGLAIFQQRVAKLGLQKLPVNLVLNSGQYQLLLVEAPKVPAEELVEALRWRIKDLINYPVAEAALDAFFLPEDSARGGNPMAYAVVCQRSLIAAQVGAMHRLQVNLAAIDIPELALRNLTEACCDTRRGVALVRLEQGGGSLEIVRSGNLYLARQFSLSYNAGLLDDLPADALVLELQRSLDYFERQLRQPPPGQVYLCGENLSEDKLTPDIRNNLAVGVDLLNLEQGLQIAEGVQPHILPLCLTALGAALRQEQPADAGKAGG